MEETLTQKRSRILEETASAYNKNTRSITENGGCYYFMKGKIGCAIGRLIEDKSLCERLDQSSDSTVKGVFDKLPKDIQELGVDYLTDLQPLHDDAFKKYWDDNGITAVGQIYVDTVKNKYGLN